MIALTMMNKNQVKEAAMPQRILAHVKKTDGI